MDRRHSQGVASILVAGMVISPTNDVLASYYFPSAREALDPEPLEQQYGSEHAAFAAHVSVQLLRDKIPVIGQKDTFLGRIGSRDVGFARLMLVKDWESSGLFFEFQGNESGMARSRLVLPGGIHLRADGVELIIGSAESVSVFVPKYCEVKLYAWKSKARTAEGSQECLSGELCVEYGEGESRVVQKLIIEPQEIVAGQAGAITRDRIRVEREYKEGAVLDIEFDERSAQIEVFELPAERFEQPLFLDRFTEDALGR